MSDCRKPVHLYAIAAKEVKRVKIGFSRDPSARLLSCDVGSPCHLSKPIVASDIGRVEAGVHTRLNRWRYKGEWFAMSPDVNMVVDMMAHADGCSETKLRLVEYATRDTPLARLWKSPNRFGLRGRTEPLGPDRATLNGWAKGRIFNDGKSTIITGVERIEVYNALRNLPAGSHCSPALHRLVDTLGKTMP